MNSEEFEERLMSGEEVNIVPPEKLKEVSRLEKTKMLSEVTAELRSQGFTEFQIGTVVGVILSNVRNLGYPR